MALTPCSSCQHPSWPFTLTDGVCNSCVAEAERQAGWVPPPPIDPWAPVRVRRNALLAASDWTQLPDVPEATQLAWRNYRQALRDVPEQGDPAAVIWPDAPEASA